MRKMKHIIFTFTFIVIALRLFSQIPAGYYDSAEGLEGDALRQSLHNIIDGHNVISYNGLWNVYEDSDLRPDGKIWDMYSTCDFTFDSDQCGNYSSICDCYNREHTVPKSWFNDASPMVSDAHHIVPTDGKVNGYRSNYPYGECSSGTTWGTGKLGSCTYPGYSGTVFEPADEYKGDFARIYFYSATRYMDVISNWSGASFSANDFSDWTRKMLLEWHHSDPVSQKEIDRNNAIHDYQYNRNPFIDNPTWADAIWDPDYLTSYAELTNAFVQVYPNPAKEYIEITQSSTENKETSVFISDISGRILISTTMQQNTTISLQGIPQGVYFVLIKSSAGKRIIKKIAVID